ncbi:MAG: hypothetical protein HY318_03735 [Armatimonadetes bacterium]|nr:hypothetical protein [Armatimonadota bacterium]
MKPHKYCAPGNVVGWLLFTLFTGLVVVAILFPMFAGSCPPDRRKIVYCQSQMKQLALAINIYESENGHLPDPGQWERKIRGYLKNEQLLHCPKQDDANPGYAMNRNLSGKTSAGIVDAANTVLLYEVDSGGHPVFRHPACGSGWCARTHYKFCPHGFGCNFDFVDEHVKWFRESEARALLKGVAP